MKSQLGAYVSMNALNCFFAHFFIFYRKKYRIVNKNVEKLSH